MESNDGLEEGVSIGGAIAAVEVLRGVTDEKVIFSRVYEVVMASLEIYSLKQRKWTRINAVPSVN